MTIRRSTSHLLTVEFEGGGTSEEGPHTAASAQNALARALRLHKQGFDFMAALRGRKEPAEYPVRSATITRVDYDDLLLWRQEPDGTLVRGFAGNDPDDALGSIDPRATATYHVEYTFANLDGSPGTRSYELSLPKSDAMGRADEIGNAAAVTGRILNGSVCDVHLCRTTRREIRRADLTVTAPPSPGAALGRG